MGIFIQSKDDGLSVQSQITDAYFAVVHKNHMYTEVVADVLWLTAVEGTAQRGKDESESSNNKANFLELLSLTAKYNNMVRKNIASGPHNAKYTHLSIQMIQNHPHYVRNGTWIHKPRSERG